MPLSFKKIDKQNRIVIPQKLLDQLNIRPEDFVKVVVENGSIILRPVQVVEKEA